MLTQVYVFVASRLEYGWQTRYALLWNLRQNRLHCLKYIWVERVFSLIGYIGSHVHREY